MTSIEVNLHGEGAWPDIDPENVWHAETDWELAVVPGGMSSGAPSVALRLKVTLDPTDQDGTIEVVAETSLAAWITATAAIRGGYPEEFAGGALAAPEAGS